MKTFMKNINYLQMALLIVVCALSVLGVIGAGGNAHLSIAGMLIPLAFGVVAATPGSPDLTTQTGNGEIPILYADKVIEKFYDASVAPFTSNSDYEGQIRKMGDTVIINTIPDVLIQDYTVNGTINWQLLAKGKVQLQITRASYYAFRMDDITLTQLKDKKTMDEYSKDGAEQMRISIDTKYLADIYLHAAAVNQGLTAGRKSGNYNLGVTGSPVVLNKGNITDVVARMAAVAEEQNWPRTGRWLAIPTWAKYLLDTSELKDVSVTGMSMSPMLNGGYFKTLYDFDIFCTNLYTPVVDNATNCYNITFGHKTGVTFAAQLTDMEYFDKFENTIGKGMRGLEVYDWAVVKPESVGVLYARM
jgi:hypothetical protein